MAKKIKVILKKSPIGSSKRQRATLKGLGLRRVNSFSIMDYTPELKGMIRKVSHLVEVEEV